jgi:DNA-binding PadR family transcriptional regulator
MARGDATRLFLLAELDRRGQAHGHELRREARIGRTELWTDVGIGAIYHTLRRMEADGLIEAVRNERAGRLPERTIYAITTEGRRELSVLGDAILREVRVPADPFDLAFSVAQDMPIADLAAVIADRIRALQGRLAELEHQRSAAAEHLDHRDELLFEHLLARLRAELGWHQQLASDVSEQQEGRSAQCP